MNTKLDLATFRALDTFIGPQLSSIASSIGEQCTIHALQNAQITDHKFLYFNKLNLALKTSVSFLMFIHVVFVSIQRQLQYLKTTFRCHQPA